MNPAAGPAKAKSNKAFEFGGGDFNGVMAPAIPVIGEGMMFGTPTSNYNKIGSFFFNTKKKSSACASFALPKKNK